MGSKEIRQRKPNLKLLAMLEFLDFSFDLSVGPSLKAAMSLEFRSFNLYYICCAVLFCSCIVRVKDGWP